MNWTGFQIMTILSTFTHHIYLIIVDMETSRKDMTNDDRGSKHTDTIWFQYFPCGHQGYLSHFRSVLLHVMLVVRSFYGVLILIYPISLASWLMIESSCSLLYSGYRHGPIFIHHFPTTIYTPFSH